MAIWCAWLLCITRALDGTSSGPSQEYQKLMRCSALKYFMFEEQEAQQAAKWDSMPRHVPFVQSYISIRNDPTRRIHTLNAVKQDVHIADFTLVYNKLRCPHVLFRNAGPWWTGWKKHNDVAAIQQAAYQCYSDVMEDGITQTNCR